MLTNLKEKYGMSSSKNVVCLDRNNIFVKGGLSVIASLAGEGKTTYLHKMSEQWEKEGFDVMHMNFDQAPTYGKEMYDVPMTAKDYKEMLGILMEEASNTDILIIDSFKALLSYLGLDVESNVEVFPLMQEFRLLSAKTGLSIILVHHVYKPKNVKTMLSSFYGSRCIEEQCDSGFIYSCVEGNSSVRIVKSRTGYTTDYRLDKV